MRNRKSWGRQALVFALLAGGLVLAGCGLFTKQMTSPSGTLNPLDELEWEGDTLRPVEVFLYVGPAAEGATVQQDIILYIERKKGGHEFENGAEVTVTLDKDETKSDAGLKDHVTPDSVTITLPADWLDQGTGTLSNEIKFRLKFTIPTGFNFERTYVLHFTATGPGYDKKGNKISLALEENVQIKFYEEETPTYTLSGAKWEDKDADGVWDANELGLPGWPITLYKWDTDNSAYVKIADTTTGQGGAYSFANLPPGKYKLEEELQQGWAQTFPSVGYHEVEIVDANIGDLNFGNVRTYSISGAKWYDRNKDGDWDTDEPAITGWKIYLYAADGTTLLASASTGANGYKFENLKPGTYVVKEGPVSGAWIQTFPLNPNFHTVTIVDDDVTGVNFGNVCEITATGGYTLGFWSNRNGQAALCADWASYLSGYNLVKKNGDPFDPSSATELKNWLLSADATNMSYMLSVQLAATLLNMKCKGTSYTGLGIVVGGEWKSIDEVISMANSFLGTYNNTPAGHAKRGEAEFYKNVLDALNNNRLKLIPYDPCPVPTWP